MSDAWNEEERGPKLALIERPKRTIWKYQIPVLEDFEIELPKNSKIIRFGNEGGMLWLWAVVRPDNPKETRRLLAFKTGAEIPEGKMKYLGMAPIFIQAELMLYYFEPISSRKEQS